MQRLWRSSRLLHAAGRALGWLQFLPSHSTCELARDGGNDSGLGVLAPEGGRRAGEGGSEPAGAGSKP